MYKLFIDGTFIGLYKAKKKAIQVASQDFKTYYGNNIFKKESKKLKHNLQKNGIYNASFDNCDYRIIQAKKEIRLW